MTHRQWISAVGIYFICVEQCFDFTTYMNLIWERNMSLDSHQNFGMWEKKKRKTSIHSCIINFFWGCMGAQRWVNASWVWRLWATIVYHWECLNGSKHTTLCNHQRALRLITEVEIEKFKCKILCTDKRCTGILEWWTQLLCEGKCSCSWTLVLPGLQVLDARQHVQMACRILLNHIHYIIRPQALFKPPLSHQETHDTESKTSTSSQLKQQYQQKWLH